MASFLRPFAILLLAGCASPPAEDVIELFPAIATVERVPLPEERRAPSPEEMATIDRVISAYAEPWGLAFEPREPMSEAEADCVRDVTVAVVSPDRFLEICQVRFGVSFREFWATGTEWVCPADERCFRACIVHELETGDGTIVLSSEHPLSWREGTLRHEVTHRVLRCVEGHPGDHTHEAFRQATGSLSLELRAS